MMYYKSKAMEDFDIATYTCNVSIQCIIKSCIQGWKDYSVIKIAALSED